MFRFVSAVLGGLALWSASVFAQVPSSNSSTATPSTAHGVIAGTVTDSATAAPLPAIEVRASAAGRVVAGTFSDAFGRFQLLDLAPGSYLVSARLLGYRPVETPVTVTAAAETRVNLVLAPAPVQLARVQVFGSAPLTVNTRTGDQQFQADQYHGPPTTTTSQIVQQSIAGAARAPTGEVHIRGQHAEFTYYVDGVPVPAGISGSLNELFDPEIINHIDFKTGGWDAEYGNKNAAIIDITTRVPAGQHAVLSGYGGSFGGNGQSLRASDTFGRFAVLLSGSRQASDMRLEPVVFDPSTNEPINFHNHGDDVFGFGKVQYTPSSLDVVNLDLDWSQTHFAVPYDSSGSNFIDDHQKDQNGFSGLSWRHQFGSAQGSPELFAGAFVRHGTLAYAPGVNDQPQFVFFPDTTTAYNLRENRQFTTSGLKADYNWPVSHGSSVKVGGTASLTRGQEDFSTTAADGSAGPASNSRLDGHDLGAYVQGAIAPSPRWELRPGVRVDAHMAPFAGTQSQVSPRVRLNLFPDAGNTLYLYYGRLFLPTNIEDLRAITSVAQAGVATTPTLPERDDFYEAGYVHRFPQGVVAKLSAYRKNSSPGIDDNTVPGSAIVTSVNIATVHVTGIEAAFEVRPPGPVSGYLNAALCHAWGHGPVTGGFFPADTPEGDFDLDHDQRVSVVGSATWTQHSAFASVTGIYGSGLTNGADPDASYGTGLFDFNKSIKVDPNFIVDASAGYALTAGRTIVRPEISVDNLFDRHYLLKGAFFSGASVGRPRSVQAKVEVAM